MVSPTSLIGATGEQLARSYLEKRGYVFLTANWRCKLGEIDLIMQQGSTRVFVEVRLRRQTKYGQGIDTVMQQKQRKLLRATQYYQQQVNYWGDLRFDVVSITTSTTDEPLIEHVTHAFGA